MLYNGVDSGQRYHLQHESADRRHPGPAERIRHDQLSPTRRWHSERVNDGIALVQCRRRHAVLELRGRDHGQQRSGGRLESARTSGSENGSVPIGESLRLVGSGSGYSDFAWQRIGRGRRPRCRQSRANVHCTGDVEPSVTSTTPAANASNVPVNSAIAINFNESVNATASAFALSCGGVAQPFSQSASPATSFTLTPIFNLPFSSILHGERGSYPDHRRGRNDPPDQMGSDFNFSFSTDGRGGRCAGRDVDVAGRCGNSRCVGANIVINFSESVTSNGCLRD